MGCRGIRGATSVNANSADAIIAATRELLERIVAANDLIALGCCDALASHGIDVPGDVSVTGFDDMAFIDRVSPPLTTVRVPFYEMGALAGTAVLSLLAAPEGGPDRLPTSTRLRPQLKVRGSSGPSAGG